MAIPVAVPLDGSREHQRHAMFVCGASTFDAPVLLEPSDRETTVGKMRIGAVIALALILWPDMTQAQPAQSVSPPAAPSMSSGHVGTPMALGDAENAARPIAFKSMTEPTYPQLEERQGITGTVVLLITIDSNGVPVAIEIARSSHNRHLDGAVIDTARTWKFEPISSTGKGTRNLVRVSVDFQLRKDRRPMFDDSDIAVPVGQH